MSRNTCVCRFTGGLLALLIVLIIANSAFAVAPMPGTLEKWKAEGTLEKNLAILKAFRDAGGDAPSANLPFSRERMAAKAAFDPNAVDTINVIVILVDFYDNWATVGDSAKFDSMLFSVKGDPDSNATGSMTDYYFENSYGKLFIRGDVTHWLRMSNSYASYVGTDMGLGPGGRLLARDAALAADSFVNFAKYDNDGNNIVDGIIVVHAGKGAEEGGDSTAIWSHRSNLSTSLTLDGKSIYAYTMNPEKFLGAMVPIGVFCHEYGHILGLPDLYDTDYTPSTSDGLGSWSLMASGNYNGSSKLPAHFDPWCKINLGFLVPDTGLLDVTSNLYQAPIPAVEYNAMVYRILGEPGGSEYWLVENRQRVGFDLGLPASGLLIYHVDGAVPNNDNYLRYKVALEQADGFNDLALTAYGADAGDPWPGNTVNRNFHDMSNPNAHDNATDSPTEVGVWRITNSDSIMYADLDVEYSRPHLALWSYDSVKFMDTVGLADGDGMVEAGETADVYFRVRNFMRSAYYWYLNLSCNDPDVQIITNNVTETNYLNPVLTAGVVTEIPIRLSLAPTAKTKIVTFRLIIEADSLVATHGDKRFVDTFYFDAELGAPRILVLDDDEGFSFDTLYTNALRNLRVPHRVWSKIDSIGSPPAAEMSKYTTILWLTGDTLNGGALNAQDIASLKTFLDGGGNLAFASLKGSRLLWESDSMFMKDYLRARWDPGTILLPITKGVTGNPVGDTFAYRGTTHAVGGLLNPLNGGQTSLIITNATKTQNYGSCAVTYSGAYKSFVMSWGPEFISDNWGGISWATKQTFVDQILKFFGESIVTDVNDPDGPSLPSSIVLHQNYPNPFNPSTEISYTLNPVRGASGKLPSVNLAIYNLLGQKVVTLVDAVQPAGTYSVSWDGANQAGWKVASGVYFYRLTRGEESVSRKMLLLK
ncbi:MAG: M6 family metalloprotease domain-containing protein [Candidatus Zixiibacteriota bacterium]